MTLGTNLNDFHRRIPQKLPLLRIFSCLYCGECFSIKRHLKQHYVESHAQSIPNYVGKRETIAFFNNEKVIFRITSVTRSD
jgi:hypothetical protein